MLIHKSIFYLFLIGFSFFELKAATLDVAVENVCMCNPMSDSLALVALYEATDGANWANVWDLEQPMDSWYGVVLDEERCIINIALGHNGLIGNIPSELGQLSKVEDVDFSTNQIEDVIPAELGQLISLKKIDFSYNQLNGSIPSELGQLINLENLYLDRNLLSNTIPYQLGQLSNLRHLYLLDNQLSGNIPPELGQLANLTILLLRKNQLSGNIPPELGQLSSLTSFDLQDNQLSGNIPFELGQLSNLENLHLENNQLSSSIPSELGQLFSLKKFYLNNNQISGSIPSELGQLTSLQELIFSDNQISGNIPIEFEQLSSLLEFDLSNNELSGNIPAELGQIPLLQRLHLSHNQLSGNIPATFGLLSNLKELLLDFNNLNGNIPSEIGGLSDVRILNFSNNLLTGNIPAELGSLTKLIRLYFHNNQLDGNIPIELGNLTTLELLLLDNNQLSGSIPTELGNLSNLEYLYLYNNQLSGSIPMELGNLMNLQYFHLNGNQLSGSIPVELGGLENLYSLRFNNNQLSGSIPVELGNLTNLEYIWLHVNQLSGSIPAELSNLTNLSRLYLYNNELEGCFPLGLNVFCDLGFSTDVYSIGYNFTSNPNLPNSGDFTTFCTNSIGACFNNANVWPGDTNTDGIVDYNDILNLGIHHGVTGSNRLNASPNWFPQPATAWAETQVNGANMNHVDPNGDGLGDNSTDGPVISLNYGKTHNNGIASTISNFNGATILQPTWNNTNQIQLRLNLAQLLGANTTFYGIGFTLDYSEISTNATLSVENSNMGIENQNLYAFSKNLGNGQMDIVLVRTDGNNVTTSPSNNQLCDLIFQVDDTNPETDLQLKFHNIKIIDVEGNEVVPMLGTSTTIVFDANESLVTAFNLLINSTFVTDCATGSTATALPSGGLEPYTYLWDTCETSNEAQNLSVGMHQVTVTDAANNVVMGEVEVFGDCAVLPLESLDFDASPKTSSIALDWTTINETNIKKFELQRSLNGIDFNTIATVTATNKSFNEYQWIDEKVEQHTRYYYQIKMIEQNGEHHLSAIKTAEISTNQPSMISVYPNPTKEKVTLILDENNSTSPVQLRLYNQLGQVVFQTEYPVSNDEDHQLTLDLRDYDKGLYFVEVLQNYQTFTAKIIKE